MKEYILHSVEEGIRALEFLREEESLQFISDTANLLADCFEQGGKVLIAGNGGSLCDAMHFAEELTGVFREKRRALPAIALSCPGHLTCVSNDLGFDQVFARGVEAYGQSGDLLVVLTTSGNSPNILEATHIAKKMGLMVIAFLGKEGGAMKGQADLEWCVSGFPHSDRVQETHMAAIHIIIEMAEKRLFHEAEITHH